MYGTLAWQDKMERKAAHRGRSRVEATEIGLLFYSVYVTPEDQINSSIEIAVGLSLHHTLVNRVDVLSALSTLTNLQRWCLIHKHWHELPDAEVAARYEITENAVRKARSRGYSRMIPLI